MDLETRQYGLPRHNTPGDLRLLVSQYVTNFVNRHAEHWTFGSHTQDAKLETQMSVWHFTALLLNVRVLEVPSVYHKYKFKHNRALKPSWHDHSEKYTWQINTFMCTRTKLTCTSWLSWVDKLRDSLTCSREIGAISWRIATFCQCLHVESQLTFDQECLLTSR